jgi:hypothetical protein
MPPAAPVSPPLDPSMAAAQAPPVAAAPSVAAPPSAGKRNPSNRTLFLYGGGAAVLLVIIVVAATRGCGGDDKTSDNTAAGDSTGESMADLEERWRGAGLEPGGFAPIDGQALGGGDCQSGAVDGMDVTVCAYPTADRASAARKPGLAAIGSATGAAVTSEDRMLVVIDRKGADPAGRSIDKIIKVFQGKPLVRPGPPKE